MKTSEYAAQPCSLTWTKSSSDRRRDWHSKGYGRRHRPETHLPLLNGGLFQSFSRDGGIITAVQVAYWTSLLTVTRCRRLSAVPIGGGGQGQDRTVDLPLFRRSVVTQTTGACDRR
jgi:hypothetical protein